VCIILYAKFLNFSWQTELVFTSAGPFRFVDHYGADKLVDL